MHLSVYLSGEIHTHWREAISEGAADAGLDVAFSGPVTDHAASDDCGATILGTWRLGGAGSRCKGGAEPQETRR